MNKIQNLFKNHLKLSITIFVIILAIIISSILFVLNKKHFTQNINSNNNLKQSTEISALKEIITLNINTQGLEIGTEVAVFENLTNISDSPDTSENTTNETTIEKTFIIIALSDSEFENVTSNVENYETGTITENGCEILTSNPDLIALANLDSEKIQNSITVINSNLKEDNSWDIAEDAIDTKVDLTKENKDKNKNGPKYYLKVSYTSNVVAIYTQDDSGKYTNLVKTMVCSSGVATPKGGVYKLNYKYRWLPLFGGVYGQYCSRITGNILFHSVPYLRNNAPDSLEYWEYDKLGTSASAGCIRLTVADAKWIYENCSSGCYVEFCTTLNVVKPSAQKISSNTTCRNYDPTDPVANNPWRTYIEPSPEPTVTPTSSTTPEPSITPEPSTTPTSSPSSKPDITPEPSTTPTPPEPTPTPSVSPTEPIETPTNKGEENIE